MNTITPTSAVLEASRCITFNPLRSELMGYTKHCMNCGKTEAEHATETVSGEFHVTDSGTKFVPKGKPTRGPWIKRPTGMIATGDKGNVRFIAEIVRHGSVENPGLDPEDEANAALIAKAWLIPELLAALEGIASLGGNLSDDVLTERTGPNDAVARGIMYTGARQLAIAALAKATL